MLATHQVGENGGLEYQSYDKKKKEMIIDCTISYKISYDRSVSWLHNPNFKKKQCRQIELHYYTHKIRNEIIGA